MKVIVKRGKDKYKIIDEKKLIINRNTPVGEDADFYEKKPYGGKKMIDPLVIIGEYGIEHTKYKVFDYEKNKWVISERCPKSLIEFIKNNENQK